LDVQKLKKKVKDQARGGGASIIGIISVETGHDVGGWCNAAPPGIDYYGTWEGFGKNCNECND
jgi:hypothetical protein